MSRRDLLRLGAGVCMVGAAPTLRAAAALIRRPYLQNVRSDGASILWTTTESGSGSVLVGRPDGSVFTVAASVRAFPTSETKLTYPFFQYQADLTGLEPGVEYAYRIKQNGATLTAAAGTFRTAAPGPFSFAVFGDTGEDTPAQRAIISRIGSEPGLSFLMHTGDLAYPQGTFERLDAVYFGLNSPLFERLPVFPTPGNHDYYADSAAPYVASHALPDNGVNPADRNRYYSYDWGEAHFTSVDTNLLSGPAADRMLAWLENDLRSTRQFWKIVFMHHPPYPTGHHSGDAICAIVRARMTDIVERWGVQLVISGHEHGYERTLPLSDTQPTDAAVGTTYVITGGGGATLHDSNGGGNTIVALSEYNYLRVDVDGRTLNLRAIGMDGRELDRFFARHGYRPN